MDKFAHFLWGWRDRFPVRAVADILKEHPTWEIYTWDTRADWQEIFLAENVEQVEAAYRVVYKQMIEEVGDEFEMPEFYLWED